MHLLRKEYELLRIWDSLTFEDEVADDLTISLEASGALDETQTRKLLCPVMRLREETPNFRKHVHVACMISSTAIFKAKCDGW